MPRTPPPPRNAMLECLGRFRSSGAPATRIIGLLRRFYPDGDLAARDVGGSRAWRFIAQLAGRGDLQKVDNRHLGARYRITLQGKCRVLCHELGIKFLCLCILAEAYDVHRLQRENGCPLSYSLFETDKIFEGLYSRKTVRNSANILTSRGLAQSISNNLIRVREDTMGTLDGHRAALAELHEWIPGIPVHVGRLALKDPEAYGRLAAK